MDDITVALLTRRLVGWLDRLMPAGERADALRRALTDTFGDRPDPVTAGVCAEIERVARRYSGHLAVAFDADGTGQPDTASPGWPSPDAAAVRARAGSVAEVRRLPGAGCLIRLDGLDPLPLAQPYLEAAFALAADAGRVVLDLRTNGGGDPATVAHVAGWLLGDDGVDLSTVVYRDRTHQWCTADRPAGTALPPDVAVQVLIGAGTFASAEALAYHVQAHRRATLIGAATPGAADHVTPIRLAATVTALLPEAYVVDAVTGTNWEGRGVQPDVRCDPADALTVALPPAG